METIVIFVEDEGGPYAIAKKLNALIGNTLNDYRYPDYVAQTIDSIIIVDRESVYAIVRVLFFEK